MPSDPEASPFCLLVILAPEGSPHPPGSVVTVPAGGGSLGRDPDNDIYLADRSISRRHAHIRVDDDALFVTAVTPTNGTFAAGSRLQPGDPPARIALDERLQVGGVVLCLASTQETEPVLDPLGPSAEEPPFLVTWDAGHCTIHVRGHELRGITGLPARFLGMLAETPGAVVHLYDLYQALGTTHLAPLASTARRALGQATSTVLGRDFVVARLERAGLDAPRGAEVAKLTRSLLENRRDHGYVLHLRPDDVRIERV